MKVLIHGEGTQVRGAEKQCALIAQGLASRGHTVIVSCEPGTEFQNEIERRGVATVHVRPRGNLDLPAALRFSRWIRSENADAVILTAWKHALTAAWAARRGCKGRIIQRIGNTKPQGSRTGEWRARRTLAKYVDGLVVTSGAVADFWAERFPFLQRTDINVIWSAIEPIPDVKSMLRRELSIGDAPLLLAVGSLVPNKSHRLLVAALAHLPADTNVVLAGWGSQAVPLREQAAALGAQDRVHLLGDRNDIPNLLAAADAFVHTSVHDGTPVAVLEAMSAGVPVVSTPVAGTEIALSPAAGRGPAGWLVPHEDPETLAAALRPLLARPRAPETDARVAEARWRMEHWFGLSRMIDAWEQVLFGTGRYDDGERRGVV